MISVWNLKYRLNVFQACEMLESVDFNKDGKLQLEGRL